MASTPLDRKPAAAARDRAIAAQAPTSTPPITAYPADEPTPPRQSFADRMRENALQRVKTQSAVRSQVTQAVLGDHPRGHLGVIIDLANDFSDHVAEVIDQGFGGVPTWTTVHQGKNDHIHFHSQDVAMLHLIARRNGDRSHGAAAGYAARLLNVPNPDA
jgi:hypothetical protein